jgi:hypothetical protein
MPMLYVIQFGGNFTEKTPSEEIIYIVCSLHDLVQLNQEFYFSDGHPVNNLTTFYDKSKLEDILDIIDWVAIDKPYWGGEENLEPKRKKQAEFLIKGDIPFYVIKKFICYNDKAKDNLVRLGVKSSMIQINENAYF